MNDLTLEFESLEEFYQAAKTRTTVKIGMESPEDIENENDPGFRGLSNEDIQKYKYGYTPGIEKLESLDDLMIPNGASKFKNKWDDTDGDDMDLERAYEGKPFLSQRVRTKGDQNGKFISLYVAIHENCWTDHNRMLNRTYTSVAIADYLEQQGYRVEIIAYSLSVRSGEWRGTEEVNGVLSMYVTLKQFGEDLNKSLLITALSPWFFRYWTFLYWCNNFKTRYGLGSSKSFKEFNLPTLTTSTIVIDNGECLNKEDSIRKIEEIMDFFGDGDA